MQLDEKKINKAAGKRDWYVTYLAEAITAPIPAGTAVIVFRQHGLAIVDAEQFKRDEPIESVSFPAGGVYAASGD